MQLVHGPSAQRERWNSGQDKYWDNNPQVKPGIGFFGVLFRSRVAN
jgi:hypothetical protein